MSKRKARGCTPSDTEEAELFHSLAKCKGATPTVLAIVPTHCGAYIPASLDQDLLTVLSNLYKKDYLSLGYSSLLQIARETKLTLTVEQAKRVETKVPDMVKNENWEDNSFKVQNCMLH